MKTLTKAQADTRDMLLFREPYDKEKYLGGVRRFDHADQSVIRTLVKLGIADGEECQNYAPTTNEILGFLSEREGGDWTMHGYAVSTDREDCRVTIEGVTCEGPYEMKDIVEFCQRFSGADEFNVDYEFLHCWFD